MDTLRVAQPSEQSVPTRRFADIYNERRNLSTDDTSSSSEMPQHATLAAADAAKPEKAAGAGGMVPLAIVLQSPAEQAASATALDVDTRVNPDDLVARQQLGAVASPMQTLNTDRPSIGSALSTVSDDALQPRHQPVRGEYLAGFAASGEAEQGHLADTANRPLNGQPLTQSESLNKPIVIDRANPLHANPVQAKPVLNQERIESQAETSADLQPETRRADLERPQSNRVLNGVDIAAMTAVAARPAATVAVDTRSSNNRVGLGGSTSIGSIAAERVADAESVETESCFGPGAL
ncbi:MAG: hypothetical protein AAF499_07035 [Pseudomonadota bacterium]